LRFNAHKSLAARGKHSSGILNTKDFEGASLNILCTHPSEESALEAEASWIQKGWAGPKECLNKTLPLLPKSLYWVYVIQSLKPRAGSKGQPLPGFFYVGMTTDPARRLRQHNGTRANGKPGLKGGGKYTSQHRPWVARALHGPYFSRSEALRAEHCLKRQKRGPGRLKWSTKDSEFCRGLGPDHPWITQNAQWKPPPPAQWRKKNNETVPENL
jgi:predicted GIY-YIG superfamily endonuclease